MCESIRCRYRGTKWTLTSPGIEAPLRIRDVRNGSAKPRGPPPNRPLWDHASRRGGDPVRPPAPAHDRNQSSLHAADPEAAARLDRERQPAGQQLKQLLAHELAAPALERPDGGRLASVADRAHDLIEVGTRGHELVSETRLRDPVADQRLAQRDPRSVGRIGVVARPAFDRRRGRLEPRRDRLQYGGPSPASEIGAHAADGLELLDRARLAARDLDQRYVAQHRTHRAVLGPRC